ncbi:MAG: prepilin-type N-terminal cleavage/methylation domain-containing protein [Myxococcales bacterium]|nr:prepilin-type N-terminal cleavage/methylation domain-containing protein [Myxococcales bacterium]
MARGLLFSHAMVGRKTRRAKGAAGFTLVELGAVVAIIGILAVIAIAGYRKYILHSKITEAQNGISAIKIAQEDFRAERGVYADLGASYCPAAAGVHDRKVGWDPGCSGGGSLADPRWQSLPVHMSGAVQFRYATVAGNGTYTAPADANWVTITTPPNGLWYVAMARCDLDGDTSNVDTQLASMSFSNQIFIRNDGQ